MRRQPLRNGKVKILVQNGIPVYLAPVVSIEAGRMSGKMQEDAESGIKKKRADRLEGDRAALRYIRMA